MPYSTSVPITRRTVMLLQPAPSPRSRQGLTVADASTVRIEPRPHRVLAAASVNRGTPWIRGVPLDAYGWLQVLARVADRVDGPTRLGALAARDERADVDDALALLAGDAGPVVGVGGVRQVLVLPELVHAGV